MRIIEYFSAEDKAHWLSEIKKSDWIAGQLLGNLLEQNKLWEFSGAGALVPLLIDGDKLVSFCTFGPHDEIYPTEQTPWIGFVYTFPEYRGHGYVRKLLDYGESIASTMGKENIYISTTQEGLYEKYGYAFLDIQKNTEGKDTRVYIKNLQTPVTD